MCATSILSWRETKAEGVALSSDLLLTPLANRVLALSHQFRVLDLHATMLHLLGFDHTRLTYRYAGRDFRLTDVHGQVVKALII